MSIQIYIGPMYAGKTTRLIHMYTNTDSVNKIIIDYDNTTYSNQQNDNIFHSCMKTHDNVIAPNVYKCKNIKSLFNIDTYQMFSEDIRQYYYNMFQSCEHIYINECQFFQGLTEFVLKMLSYGKKIYLFGLDGDYKQNIIGETFKLIPYASTVEKITGKCNFCQERSIISHRITNSKEVYLPDANAYVPTCLICKRTIECGDVAL